MKLYSTLSQTMNELRKAGYTEDFNLDQIRSKSAKGGTTIFTNEFKVDRYFRFEGDSNPSDSSILYAISSKKKNLKGLLVNAYGIYSEPETDELVKSLQIRK
ncbi:MAG TPA: hypothetical protein VMR70_11690 [Flavisolibacter sp.]|nr:hypothetical protein [Flavisolibacter sp.]